MRDWMRRAIGLEAKTAPPEVHLNDTDARGWLEAIFGARRGASGVAVTPESALNCPVVYASTAAIAQAVAQLPLHLYRRLPDGGKERATDHPLYALLHDEPNEWTSSYELRLEMTSAALRYSQGAFAFVNRVGGQIAELVQIPSASVSLETDPLTREPIYAVTDAKGRVTRYDRTEILHLQAMSGVCPVHAAREAIGTSIAMERHAARLFGRGARPSGVLTLPPQTSRDALKAAHAQWHAAHGGDQSGGTAILPSGVTWTPVIMSSVDAQFQELRAQQVVEIARAFRVPPPMIQELGRATWSNTEQLAQQFLTLTLTPWLTAWQGAIRRSLIAPDERGQLVAEFLTDDLVRADLAARIEAYSKAIAARILLPNEARAAENRSPIPGGDEFPPIPGAAVQGGGA